MLIAFWEILLHSSLKRFLNFLVPPVLQLPFSGDLKERSRGLEFGDFCGHSVVTSLPRLIWRYIRTAKGRSERRGASSSWYHKFSSGVSQLFMLKNRATWYQIFLCELKISLSNWTIKKSSEEYVIRKCTGASSYLL